jgi:transposase
MKRRRFTTAFKAQIVQELLAGEKTASQLASRHQLNPTLLTQWKGIALKGLPGLFDEKRSAAADKEAHAVKLQELYEQIGRLTTENAWLKKKSGIEDCSR